MRAGENVLRRGLLRWAGWVQGRRSMLLSLCSMTLMTFSGCFPNPPFHVVTRSQVREKELVVAGGSTDPL